MKKYRKISVKILWQFLVLLVLVAVLVGQLIYYISYSRSLTNKENQLTICGRYSADIIEENTMLKWLDEGTNESYLITQKDLNSIKEEFKITDLFVYRLERNEDGSMKNQVTFLFDIVSEDQKNHQVMSLGDVANNIPEYDAVKAVAETGKPQFMENFQPENREELLACFVPMTLDDGQIYGVIGLSYPMAAIKSSAVRTSIWLVAVFEGVIMAFAVVMLWFVSRGVIRPVRLLSERMSRFVAGLSGDSELKYEPVTEIHTKDEIEQMTDHFNSMAGAIVRYTEDLKTAAAVQERTKAELDVAGSIRSAVSAENDVAFFSERTDFDLYASLKNTVYNSCSFCNYFLTSEDHLFIVMGESVGKTLPALLMSMLASASIRCLAGTGAQPYRIAAETNDQLCGFERNDKSMTVSALILDIDLSDGTLRYINAGMPPMLIKPIGEAYQAMEESIQFNLGEMKNVSFTQKTLQLQQGYTLILTSHGVSEMRSREGEQYTLGRVEKSINRIAGETYELRDMIGELENRLNEFRGEKPAELDTTILGFRYFG